LAAQGVQELEPSSENFPAGHHVHSWCDCAPYCAEYVPLGHSWHVVLLAAPSASENVPGPHSTHALALDASDHRPFSHGVQALALPLEYVPWAQTPHTLAPAAENSPAAHERHADARAGA
jgi:hypothetical protein